MKKVDFGKNFTTTISGFFQYDYGQIIDVYNTGTNIENLQFEFIQNGQQISVFGEYVELTNSYHVQIPDTFLQKQDEILTYIYYEDPNKGQTIKILIVKISPREKYNPSPDPHYHSVIEQILEDLAKIQEEIDNWTISQEQLDVIIEEVESQIDLNNYYDKTEVDNLLNNKADKSEIPDVSGLATKQELNSGLASKANSADVYTKSEVDNLIPDISGLATKQELTNGLAGKADASTTYTKTETDNLLSTKANSSSVYTKTEIDNLLDDKADTSDLPDMTNYYTKTEADNLLSAKANSTDVYTKSEVYTKTEIDATIGDIQTLLEAI